MSDDPFGEPHPKAARQLATFGFLIGTWKGEGQSRNEDGSHSPYRMNWVGRYILDGLAIADEARVFGADDALSAHFMTYRFWDAARRRWIIEAHDLRNGKLVTQASEDLGGVQVSEESVAVMTRWPEGIGREVYLNRTDDRFSYRLDVSLDAGKNWMVSDKGLDIPRVGAIWTPRHADLIMVGTPAGMYVSRDCGKTWNDTTLILQGEGAIRSEIGGNGYLTAYWMGRYHNFITELEANKKWWVD